MKPKFAVFVLWLLCLDVRISSGQTSPIKWINNRSTLNVDTTRKDNIAYSYNKKRYKYINTGVHVTFIDTTALNIRSIAKPNDTLEILLDQYSFDFHRAFMKKRDTIANITLPFYYEGKTYREKLSYELTFGKSKLIEYDNFKIDVTNEVAKIVALDTVNEYPSVIFTHYITIKNISTKPIFISDDFVAYNDAPQFRNYYNQYVKILPGKTYKIPFQLKMDRKHRFNCYGEIEVFSEDISEVFHCEISSKFELKRK
jgi:hypothetical protein